MISQQTLVQILLQNVFDSEYPKEAAEMIMIYSSVAFDELTNLSNEDILKKGQAFAYHAEKLLGAKENTLKDAIMNIITSQNR